MTSQIHGEPSGSGGGKPAPCSSMRRPKESSVRNKLQPYGLTLNMKKTHAYQRGGASAALQQSLRDAGLTRPVSAEGMTVGGSAVGTVEYCRAHCARIAHDIVKELDSLTAALRDPVNPITFGKKFPAAQGMMLVTRVAEATRFVFTLRSMPPDTTRQAALAIDDEHDHRRIRAREMLGVAAGADQRVACRAGGGGGTADSAEFVARAPEHQPARMRQHRSLFGGQQPGHTAQIDQRTEGFGQQSRGVVDLGEIHREDRSAVMQAEQGERIAVGLRDIGRRQEHRLMAVVFAGLKQALAAPDRQEAGTRIGQGCVHRSFVVPQFGHPVEWAAGVGVLAGWGDGLHGSSCLCCRKLPCARLSGNRAAQAMLAVCPLTRDIRDGRSAADVLLANPVRTGR